MCIEKNHKKISKIKANSHTLKKSWNCSYSNKTQLKSHWSFSHLQRITCEFVFLLRSTNLSFSPHMSIYKSEYENNAERPWIATKRISHAVWIVLGHTFRGQVAFICILETRGLFCIPTNADKQNSNVWKAKKKNISRRRGFAKVIRWKTRSFSFFFNVKICCIYKYAHI